VSVKDTLSFGIKVDLGILKDAERAITAIRKGMLDNKGRLTPLRRLDVLKALDLLQGGPS
jgi:hypothetical protein